MAKVTCSLCGRKFDLFANASVCPKCGCHYHEDGELSRSYEGSHEHSELHKSYDGGNYNHNHYDGAGLENKHYDGAGLDNKHYDGAGLDNKHYDGAGVNVKYDGAGVNVKHDGTGLEHNRKNSYDVNKVKRQYHESSNTFTKNDLKTGKRFVTFIIMIFVFINFCSVYGKIQAAIHTARVEREYMDENMDGSDIIHYDMGIWQYWTIEDIELCVTDAFIIRDNKVLAMYKDYPCSEEMQEFANYDWSRIPDGYEVVGYRYRLDSDVYSAYDFSKLATPYMVTTDGQYLKCVDPYYWDKMLSDLDATWLKDWVGYGMDLQDGVILFVVHEGTADHLMLDIRPDVLHDDSVKKPTVMYKMDIAATKEGLDE